MKIQWQVTLVTPKTFPACSWVYPKILRHSLSSLPLNDLLHAQVTHGDCRQATQISKFDMYEPRLQDRPSDHVADLQQAL